jgi:sigma-B regulation protein RsbU (phosphoserine phosphatase)
MNKKGEEYSDEKLEKLVAGMGHLSAEETLNSILDDIAAFTQGAQQSDDITALILKVK